ncbi:hypothetical protein ACHAXR_003095 [Thalassiosira sp. AJA248-18]
MFTSLKTKASSQSLFRSDTSASNISEISEDEHQPCVPAPPPDALPMPDITRPFPVVEQPSRCIFTSLDSPHFEQHRLVSTRKGAVHVATNRSDREQFLLVPVDAIATATEASDDGTTDQEESTNLLSRGNNKDMFYIRSYKFNRYLTSDAWSGSVSTIDLSKKDADNGEQQQPGESEKWLLMRSPHGGHFIVSAQNEENITCCRGGEAIRIGLKDNNDRSESWEIEFVSGELCFLSSSSSIKEEKQVRCDLMGKLTLTDDKRGWEVWRFIEMGAGKVRIVSWMHPFCIVCNHEGKVSTVGIDNAEEGCDEWTVEKAPDGHNGVVIKSVACARRILSHGEEGLTTTQEMEGESGVWQLDAAHSQLYTLSSLQHGRSIGPFPFVTNNVKQSDQLVLQQIDDEGTVRIYHKSRGQYLRSCAEGEVSCNSTPTHDTEPSELWKMEQRPAGGGYTFSSKSHNGLLAFSTTDIEGNPKLCTVSTIANDKREVWNVNPILPRAISSGKIKTFAIGTSVAVGTTVAMPFLMAGMLAVVPAEATLAASILSVGLTSAEAIASVGAIGATAAIVFREASDTLGIESEHGEDDEKDYTKRPLCGWRSW